jgi:hypothetical protein
MHDWRLSWATADMMRAAYELYDKFDDPAVTREELQAELMKLIENHMIPQLNASTQ